MKIKSYILCDNGNNLFGSHNDGKLIYNLFYNYYLNNTNWLKPEITFNSLFLDFNFDENFILIFFYSGHSNKYGQIKIDNKYYSSDYFLKLINNKNKLCSINFILDTCYSINFMTNKKYTNIIKLTYFLSQNKENKSKEFLINLKKEHYNYYFKQNNNKIVNGIFTYYFHKVLYEKKYNVNNWEMIKDHPNWKYVNIKFNQKIFFISNYNG